MQTPGSDKPEIAARWANNLQELAEATRLGIPVVLSAQRRISRADPTKHATGRRPRKVPPLRRLPFHWRSPLARPIAFGAMGDPEAVRQYGQITNREYRAMGIRVTLGPQADVGTEPRWNGISGTFGETRNSMLSW